MVAEKPMPVKEIWPKDHFRRPLLETPFHGRIQALMLANVWRRQAGFTVADVIEDVELEYFAIRNTCALIDVSPLVKYRVSGPDAAAYLDRLTLRDVSRLEPGRAHYTAWCDDDGKLLDDGLLFCLSDSEYRLYCRERHLPWLLDTRVGHHVAIEDITQRIAGLALQGPTSGAVLRRAGFAGIETLEPFAARSVPLGTAGVDVLVSRTGFTGDLGYELFVASDQGQALWDLLWKAGRLHGLRAAGYAAADMARIEAGFILGNRDYVPAAQALRSDRRRSPYETGLGWMIDFGKGQFNGRRALEAERGGSNARFVLVGLDIEGSEPAAGAVVLHRRKREVGTVTSAIWSPTAKRNIALATLERRHGTRGSDDLWVEIDSERELRPARLLVRARVVDRRFVTLERRNAMPPASF